MAAFINIDGTRINISTIANYFSREDGWTTIYYAGGYCKETKSVTPEQLDDMICRATANVCGVVKAD